jgi:hypothetical protein
MNTVEDCNGRQIEYIDKVEFNTPTSQFIVLRIKNDKHLMLRTFNENESSAKLWSKTYAIGSKKYILVEKNRDYMTALSNARQYTNIISNKIRKKISDKFKGI